MQDEGFSKSFRLLNSNDFNYLRRSSQYFAGRFIYTFVKPTKTGDSQRSRLGLTVSRKAGPAVQRNTIKRHVREYFRRDPLKFKGFDMVVIARPSLKKVPRHELGDHLRRDLKKITKLISQKSWEGFKN